MQRNFKRAIRIIDKTNSYAGYLKEQRLSFTYNTFMPRFKYDKTN